MNVGGVGNGVLSISCKTIVTDTFTWHSNMIISVCACVRVCMCVCHV